MTAILTKRERDCLEKLSLDHRDFLIGGQMVGVGKVTLQRLVDLGLAEAGPSERHYGETGWRITDNGWRCMYGMTHAEIMAMPDGDTILPLKVWSWPSQGEPRIHHAKAAK